MSMTTVSNPYPNISLPAGADEVCEWDAPGTPYAFRYFEASSRVVPAVSEDCHGSRPWSEPIQVWVAGTQYADGRIKREIVVERLHPDGPITIEQAQQLAAALLEVTRAAEAADEIDGLAPTRTGSP